MRVVLDTGILIAALITTDTPPALIYQAWRKKRFELITSGWQLDEFRRVSRYSKLRRFLKPAEAGNLGEGFDDARLDTLFLALPVSWKGTLVQYAGRLHPGKREVRIVDYVDSKVPMLARMFEKRRVGYRAMGYRENDNGTLLE